MASTRLTNTVRDQIWERLENHAFRGRRESLRKALELLAEDAYKKLVGTLPGYGKAETLPKGWVVRLKDFRVRIAGQVAAWPELLPLCEDLLREVAAPKQELVVAGSLNKNLCLPAEKK